MGFVNVNLVSLEVGAKANVLVMVNAWMPNVTVTGNQEMRTLGSSANYPDVQDGTAIVTEMASVIFRPKDVSVIQAGREAIAPKLIARARRHVQEMEIVAMKRQDVATVTNSGQVRNVKIKLANLM